MVALTVIILCCLLTPFVTVASSATLCSTVEPQNCSFLLYNGTVDNGKVDDSTFCDWNKTDTVELTWLRRFAHVTDYKLGLKKGNSSGRIESVETCSLTSQSFHCVSLRYWIAPTPGNLTLTMLLEQNNQSVQIWSAASSQEWETASVNFQTNSSFKIAIVIKATRSPTNEVEKAGYIDEIWYHPGPCLATDAVHDGPGPAVPSVVVTVMTAGSALLLLICIAVFFIKHRKKRFCESCHRKHATKSPVAEKASKVDPHQTRTPRDSFVNEYTQPAESVELTSTQIDLYSLVSCHNSSTITGAFSYNTHEAVVPPPSKVTAPGCGAELVPGAINDLSSSSQPVYNTLDFETSGKLCKQELSQSVGASSGAVYSHLNEGTYHLADNLVRQNKALGDSEYSHLNHRTGGSATFKVQ